MNADFTGKTVRWHFSREGAGTIGSGQKESRVKANEAGEKANEAQK